MIVRNDECLLRGFAYRLYSPCPTFQFLARVEIVVASISLFGREPVFVVASMQAHIADMRGHEIRGANRLAEKRLVDICEADALLCKPGKDFRIIPGCVAYFEHQRII